MADEQSPVWLTVTEAAQRMRCGRKTVYRLVASHQMRAAVVGGRRSLRFLPAWVDEALIATSRPVEIGPRRVS